MGGRCFLSVGSDNLKDEEFEIIGFGDVPQHGMVGGLLPCLDLPQAHAGVGRRGVQHLPAVGFGLFLAAMGKRKFIPFFIIGVYANLYLGLSTMKIAVMAACIGFIFVLLEKGKRDGVLEGGN